MAKNTKELRKACIKWFIDTAIFGYLFTSITPQNSITQFTAPVVKMILSIAYFNDTLKLFSTLLGNELSGFKIPVKDYCITACADLTGLVFPIEDEQTE